MKTLNHHKNVFLFLLVSSATLLFISCNNDDDDADVVIEEPTIENIEIGSGNNGIGVIGKDFHFEADLLAGNLIEDVRIKIEPRNGETYSHDWSHEVVWNEYNGVKNANVHKHFDIAEDAAEGTYDFIIIINDQNGTQLEKVETITLYLEDNLPVNPELAFFNLSKNITTGPFYPTVFTDPLETQYTKGDILTSQVGISGVKGDGIVYLLLIKKSLNHRPEAVNGIDFDKAIVYDVFEHENEEEQMVFSNVIGGLNLETMSFDIDRNWPEFEIGAETDNNIPSRPIDGDKIWTSGDYYFGIVYTNTTYSISMYRYFDLEIIME